MALPYITEAQADKKIREAVESIPAPAGGTKLYEHYIHNQYHSWDLKVFSTSPTKFDLSNIIISGSTLPIIDGKTVYSASISISDSNLICSQGILQESGQFITISAEKSIELSNLTDTVTEL